MKAYKDWIVEKALPFWSDAGFDAEHKRFRERLDRHGHAVQVPHRTMVQARQIYVFAHAAHLGWFAGGPPDRSRDGIARTRLLHAVGHTDQFRFLDRQQRPDRVTEPRRLCACLRPLCARLAVSAKRGSAAAFPGGPNCQFYRSLRQYEARNGEDLSPWTTRLYDVARRYGVSAAGLVFDELAPDMSVVKRSHRIWPHTEAMKAAVVREADGHPVARLFADTMVGALMNNFLDRPIAGGWIDHLSETRQPLVDYVPASSLYHLFFAAAEMERRFGF